MSKKLAFPKTHFFCIQIMDWQTKKRQKCLLLSSCADGKQHEISWPILHFGFFLPQKLKIKIHLQLEISSRQLIAQINNESLKLLETQFAAMLKSLMLFCETHACLPCFVKNISLEGGRRKVESDTKMFDGMQLWRWCKVLIQWL